MFNVRLAGDYLYGKLLLTWLSLVMYMLVSFCAVLFPTRCLGWDLKLNWVSFWGFSFLLFSFVRAAVACAILERTSGLEPSSETTAPRYLKLVTVPNFCPLTFISLWMSLVLFVISLVFSALISILYLVQVLSRLSTRASSSCCSGSNWGRAGAGGRAGTYLICLLFTEHNIKIKDDTFLGAFWTPLSKKWIRTFERQEYHKWRLSQVRLIY